MPTLPPTAIACAARTALPLLAFSAVLALPRSIEAQPPPTTPWDAAPAAPGAPGAYQPGAYPGAPAQPGAYPGAPAQPGAYPGAPAQPGAPPGAEPPPASFGAGPGAGPGGPSVSFGADLGLEAPEPAASKDEADDEDRLLALAEQIGLLGSTGLLRTSYAGSGAPATFRVGFLMDWFSTSGFLCNGSTPCQRVTATAPLKEDDASHVGALFALSATPFSFIEGYAAIRTFANANDRGSPKLLQVLGDTTFGVKGFTPMRIADVLTFGGELRMLLMNGAGDVGISGAGTSAEFLALTSLDFRKPHGKGVPVRVHLNVGYKLDNSGNLVEDVEATRADRSADKDVKALGRIPVSRIERFGLGINRVDFFETRFGVDVPYRWVQPYVEYTLEVPINRQNYECHTKTISFSDACLALKNLNDPNSGAPGYAAMPSRISIGARTNPLDGAFRGLSAHLGFDIGLSATSTFIEEVAPQAPWTLYFGLGYAFDTVQKKTVVQEKAAPPPPIAPPPPPPQYFVRGLVQERGTLAPVAGALVTVQGRPEPPVATGPDGRFLSHQLDPGTYLFQITATDYQPGVCQATIMAAGMAPSPVPGMGPTTPGYGPAGPGMGPTPPGYGPAGPGMGPGQPGPGAQPGVPPVIFRFAAQGAFP
ncbi:MAG: carboxypeptidase regulatory-like domain-containing protein, partial [Deltaproteobacteria bacterium]|nr:carboxypeptidase regulatory-like domain-containing protein [Deltaproteobacteria bacterium]